jgi:hypothetical protein
VDEKTKSKQDGTLRVSVTADAGQFAVTINHNLEKARVQDSIRDEHLKLHRLEALASGV